MRKIVSILYRIVNFYIKHNPIELLYAKTYHSQFGEDVFVREFFKKKGKGFYVDVGAYHPYKISNTYIFYRDGWNGINIEPNPKGYKLLEIFRKRDTNLNISISDTENEVEFICNDVFSGINDTSYKHKNKAGDSIQVKTAPLSLILEKHVPTDTQIDFLSVDCEGHDEVVLRSND